MEKLTPKQNKILDIFPDIEGFIISIANYDLSNLVSSLNSISNEVLESDSITIYEKALKKKVDVKLSRYHKIFNERV